MKYQPMLCHDGDTSLFGADHYIFEQKLDGIRCLAEIDTVRVTLYSRQGHDISAQFPDVLAQLAYLIPASDTGTLVLDGEIIAGAGEVGDFQVLQKRLQRIKNLEATMRDIPAMFVAFDILSIYGTDITNRPYMDRRRSLLKIIGDDPINGSIPMPRAYRYYSRAEMLEKFKLMCAEGCEGLIAKHTGAVYAQGTRSRTWLKIKPVLSREVYIGGYTLGIGRLKGKIGAIAVGTMDSMHVTLGNTACLRYCGLVGTGMNDSQRANIKALCDAQDTGNTTPFLHLPSSIDKQVYMFCTPIPCKVQYQELTQDGIMRFPSFQELT